MAPWKLPLVVAALAVPLVAGFLVGGPAIGVAMGALAVVTLLVVAARQRPRGPIGAPHADDTRRHVLIVVTCPVEKPAAVAAIAREAGIDWGRWGGRRPRFGAGEHRLPRPLGL